mmetsp:Transcript_22390/g.36340  ORF Transcript_22390/g.36340 Transcript_22390/m.36340 type:complete len:204 (+) Transcript_22390:55-666(+)|eukprot:CAMPEP_0196135454 /NCGR_PEP_ID=MMETSP0910-20130528/4089_1 /TAXON_ID=49265 /ORGANISM="Thalassiosira rotula, Strain GSO102" /LENGTH=203 /DNA_ID=CAMNT_0041395599 /DNA_START=99 /DNA_END=710 /DNA_ORIENTATION=+
MTNRKRWPRRVWERICCRSGDRTKDDGEWMEPIAKNISPPNGAGAGAGEEAAAIGGCVAQPENLKRWSVILGNLEEMDVKDLDDADDCSMHDELLFHSVNQLSVDINDMDPEESSAQPKHVSFETPASDLSIFHDSVKRTSMGSLDSNDSVLKAWKESVKGKDNLDVDDSNTEAETITMTGSEAASSKTRDPGEREAVPIQFV